MVKGLFITFEGPDGSGKSTQIKLLSNYLEQQHIPYILTREPGGTPISDKIREIILDPVNKEMVNETEVLLYAASRAQHVLEKIVPALEEGKVVLCDRFVDASIAYQGYGLGISIDKIKEINLFATKSLIPDRTYMVDLSPELGRQRMKKRSSNQAGALDRIEQKELEYHERVRAGFHDIHAQNKDRIVLLDGARPIEEIFGRVKEDFSGLWENYEQGI